MDISNLNIIPKSIIQNVLKWMGIVPSDGTAAKKKTGLMENITYIGIAMGGAVLLLSLLFLIIYLAKKSPR